MNKHALRGLLAAIYMAGAPAVMAAEAETPIIEFHTNIYETYGNTNAFHIVLGAKEDTYIDIDCGFGSYEAEVGEALYDQDSQSINATSISCTVSSEGMVRIYGDASLIDYFDCEGCYIDRISFPALTELQILDMSHNELKSLDLSHMTKLQSLVLSDNPFDETPLFIGANKPDLTILEISIVGHLDQSFNISDYPALASFEAYHCDELFTLDPSGCPELLRLSADVTPLTSLDVSKNAKLLILNISDTYITSIDVSKNLYLTEFYCGHAGSFASNYKITELDVSHNPSLQRFDCQWNALTRLDISKNPNLVSLFCSHNELTGIDFSNNPNLTDVSVAKNNMDFNTIPLPRPNMTEYYYEQNPFKVNKSYKTGDVIDFSSRVIREGSTTDAVIYSYDSSTSTAVLLDDEYYTWDKGKITLMKECPDSLYIAYANDLYPEAILTTTLFTVKNAEDFGKPSPVISMRISALSSNVSFGIGMDGATQENPKTFMVDFGDGKLKEFTATTSGAPTENNVTGTRQGSAGVTVYMPEAETVTALCVDGIRLVSADLTKAPELRTLTLRNCNLSALDLSWNRCLTSLDLSHNNFEILTLKGITDLYDKNVLTDINLSYNRIYDLTLNEGYSIETLDLSHNSLNVLPLATMVNIKRLNLASNLYTEVDLSKARCLESLDISENFFTSLAVPEDVPLTSLNVAGNYLYFDALPLPSRFKEYIYAPQMPLEIPFKAPVVDLTALQYDNSTVYTWYRTDGTPATEAEITAKNGVFFFAGGGIGSFYCMATNPTFPDFTGDDAYRTTEVEAADYPTVVFTEFTTTEDGEAEIAMTATKNNVTVYIDWTGDGNLVQYQLKSNYTYFPVKTHAGVRVKAYAYTEDNDVLMMCLDNIKMSSLDASNLRQAKYFFVYNSGLTDGSFTLPDTPAIEELTFSGSEVSNINLDKYTGLKHLILSENNIAEYDISRFPKLEEFIAPYNDMSKITVDNPKLWLLSLELNNFEDIDLSKAPSLEQLRISNNHLSQIDLEELTSLQAIYITENNFTFATLPPNKPSYQVYDYANQSPLEISIDDEHKVDLSSQAKVGNTETVYTWYIDTPYYDSEGNLYGENLIENDEYTIENGVTTFLNDFHNILCVMTNAVFPDLALYTNFIDVTGAAGIAGTIAGEGISVRSDGGIIYVTAPDTTPVAVFSLNGMKVASGEGSATFSGLAPGLYIVTAGKYAFKTAVR